MVSGGFVEGEKKKTTIFGPRDKKGGGRKHRISKREERKGNSSLKGGKMMEVSRGREDSGEKKKRLASAGVFFSGGVKEPRGTWGKVFLQGPQGTGNVVQKTILAGKIMRGGGKTDHSKGAKKGGGGKSGIP